MTDQVLCEKCGYPLAEVDDGEGWGHYECKFCEMQNTLDRVLAAGSMYEYQVDHLKMAVMRGQKEIKRLRAEIAQARKYVSTLVEKMGEEDFCYLVEVGKIDGIRAWMEDEK